MRRFVPALLLVALSGLVAGAAAIGVSSSPVVVYFSTPAPGSPQTLIMFRELVALTADQQSYVMSSSSERVIYQAPDRTEIVPLGKNTAGARHAIVIGHVAYEVMGTNSRGKPQWGEGPATAEIMQTDGPYAAQGLLEQLFAAKSVVQQGNEYTMSEVVPNGFAIYFGDQNGQLLYQVVVHQNDGLISSATISYAGFSTSRVIREVVHFTDFNRSPAVVPPPANELIQLVPCQGGGTEIEGTAYVCGLLSD